MDDRWFRLGDHGRYLAYKLLKIRLSTLLLCVTSAALATGWIIERQSYERRLSTRLEKLLFDVRDVEAEISAAIKNNSFAWHSILLDDGIESKDRFDELRRNRLQENVINLHEMQAVLDNNQFDFDNAEEFLSLIHI